MSVTACIITWKRQQNIPKIIEVLLKTSCIDEILIYDNSKGENLMSYRHHLLAKKSKNDCVYIQDDDCLNHSIDHLYSLWTRHPEHIIYTTTPEYTQIAKENVYGHQEMALLGWGSMFDKKKLGVLAKYKEKYGKDQCFYRESDRILTMLQYQRHIPYPSHLEKLDDRGSESLSAQPDHLAMKKLAIERSQTL